jgi:hypothetical protein
VKVCNREEMCSALVSQIKELQRSGEMAPRDGDKLWRLRTRWAALSSGAPIGLALRCPNLAVLLYWDPILADKGLARAELEGLIGQPLELVPDAGP